MKTPRSSCRPSASRSAYLRLKPSSKANKRAAFAATDAFLLANGVEVIGDSLDFADWLSKVAECDRQDRDEIEQQFADWLSGNVRSIGATISFQRGVIQAIANEPNLDLESMIIPMTDSENFSGKAYTIREGESHVEWLRRGSGESGEAREKFKTTIYHLVRMALRLRVSPANPSVPPIRRPPRI
jgi:hypothetical protein